MKKNYVITVAEINPNTSQYQLKLFTQDSSTDWLCSTTSPYLVVRDAPSLEYVLAEVLMYRPKLPVSQCRFPEEVFKDVGVADSIKLKFKYEQYPPSLEVLKLAQSVEIQDGQVADVYFLTPNNLELSVLSRQVTLLQIPYLAINDDAPNELTTKLLKLMAAHHIPIALR